MTEIQSKVLLLIVEDDPLQMMTLEDILIDAGYDVLAASDGNAAIAELKQRSDEIKGIISDIKLGSNADGWDVGQSARELVATMPMVYVSGDSAHEWASRGVPGSLMIPKPFAAAQIVTAISQLLNNTPSSP